MRNVDLNNLRKEIESDQVNSCFDINYIREYKGDLYEYCDLDHSKYRVIFSSDDYDYVEDQATINQLDKLFDS